MLSLNETFCLHMTSSNLDKPAFSRVKTLYLTDPVNVAVRTSYVYGRFSANQNIEAEVFQSIFCLVHRLEYRVRFPANLSCRIQNVP